MAPIFPNDATSNPMTHPSWTFIPNYAFCARVLVRLCLCACACALVYLCPCACARVLVLLCLCASRPVNPSRPDNPSWPSRPHCFYLVLVVCLCCACARMCLRSRVLVLVCLCSCACSCAFVLRSVPSRRSFQSVSTPLTVPTVLGVAHSLRGWLAGLARDAPLTRSFVRLCVCLCCAPHVLAMCLCPSCAVVRSCLCCACADVCLCCLCAVPLMRVFGRVCLWHAGVGCSGGLI